MFARVGNRYTEEFFPELFENFLRGHNFWLYVVEEFGSEIVMKRMISPRSFSWSQFLPVTISAPNSTAIQDDGHDKS